MIFLNTGTHHDLPVRRYQADARVCATCAHKADCSPEREARLVERIVESEVMQGYFRRMEVREGILRQAAKITNQAVGVPGPVPPSARYPWA